MKKCISTKSADLFRLAGSKKIICSVYAVIIALALVGCKSENQQEYRRSGDCPLIATYGLTKCFQDYDSIQIAACEKVLDECVKCEILDDKGVEVYRKIAENPSVARYVELIEECTMEDTFYDTVGEGDAWCDYCDYVLAPRGEMLW